MIKVVHVPGKENTLADLLSRSQITKFHAIAPWMDSGPVPVPQYMLRID